jgi:hypothetical protein
MTGFAQLIEWKTSRFAFAYADHADFDRAWA